MPAAPDFPAALAALEQALAALPTTAGADQPPAWRLDYLRALEQTLSLQMRYAKLQKKYTPAAAD